MHQLAKNVNNLTIIGRKNNRHFHTTAGYGNQWYVALPLQTDLDATTFRFILILAAAIRLGQ
jgi:hypothetical protein